MKENNTNLVLLKQKLFHKNGWLLLNLKSEPDLSLRILFTKIFSLAIRHHSRKFLNNFKTYFKNRDKIHKTFYRENAYYFWKFKYIWEPIENREFIIFMVGNINLYWYLLQKVPLSLKNLKVSKAKVLKILGSFLDKFCESHPWFLVWRGP